MEDGITKTMKGGITLSIRTITMITLGILIIVLMYLAFDNTFNTLITSFLESLVMPDV